MEMDIATDLAATGLIAGDVDPSELVVPDRELMYHRGRHMADCRVDESLTDGRRNQTSVLITAVKRFRRQTVVRTAPDALYLTRPGLAIQLRRAPALC
jgi:hypothetical protein